jgi:hypothetical protein
MAKKTKPPLVAAVAPQSAKPAAAKKIPKRPGRKKERTQISVRIDRAVMDIAHRQIEPIGMRITDLIERGIILAIRELGNKTRFNHNARLILNDEGVDFSRFIMNANILLRFPEVRALSASETLVRRIFIDACLLANTWPNAREVVNLMGAPIEAGEEVLAQA